MALKNWISRFPPQLGKLWLAVAVLAIDFAVGTLGFVLLEDYSLGNAIYMTVITISTVGFTEVEPLSLAGRWFTSVYILINIGIFAYVLATFSYYVIEGKLFKTIYTYRVKNRIDQLQQHVILCGYGKYGKEIADHLAMHNTPFVILEKSPEKIERLQEDGKRLFLEGDATQDDVLQEAGIHRAQALIAALADDSDNLYIVLTSRQLNPRLKIISRAMQERSQPKLIKAGANHVVIPENIGGFYMATLVSKPGAVEFFSFITNEYHSDIGFEELSYDRIPEPFRGRPIKDFGLRTKTGANIIGYRPLTGGYIVNPSPDIVLRQGEHFIILGDAEQLSKLRALCLNHSA